MAGRERSGPEAARGDLFAGLPWVLTSGEHTRRDHLDRIRELVRAVGAEPVEMSARSHDRAVAVVSHVPQVVASALAAQLRGCDEPTLDLAGPGIRDTTRIAGSDADLWVEILAANAAPVSVILAQVIDRLASVQGALESLTRPTDVPTSQDDEKASNRSIATSTNPEVSASLSSRELRRFLEDGKEGRQRLPGKHGSVAVPYVLVPVVIPDEPGALARLFLAAGEAGVNIEDVGIEHAPGQPVGLVELSVRPELAQRLSDALQRAGWRVH
jgi:prephenate dehydrogenase